MSAPKKTRIVKAPPKKPLGALAHRIERESAKKQTVLRAEAVQDVELILEKKKTIASAFYDIGEALARLRRPGYAESLQMPNFTALCTERLGISLTHAGELMNIAQRFTRKEVEALTQDRALALIVLADAMNTRSAVGTIAKRVLELPSGEKLRVSSAAPDVIRDAARAFRDAHQGNRPSRGRTASAIERREIAALQDYLRKAGLADVTVRAVGTRPGKPSNVRIDRVLISDIRKMGGLLARFPVTTKAKG